MSCGEPRFLRRIGLDLQDTADAELYRVMRVRQPINVLVEDC